MACRSKLLADIFECIFELLNDRLSEIIFFFIDFGSWFVHLVFSELNEIKDILAGEVSVSLLHNIKCYFGEFFVVGVDSSFDSFAFESRVGFIFDEVDFFSEFFEEGL